MRLKTHRLGARPFLERVLACPDAASASDKFSPLVCFVGAGGLFVFGKKKIV